MKTIINNKLKRFHSDEGGAIALLVLATVLILFMLALTLFDTGIAARDKMDVQIAADTSAFTHSVVKSRSMNMIAYSNTIKRMFFSYAVTYVNGLTALVLVTALHSAKCFRLIPNPKSCYELGQNALIIISEFIEAIVDVQTLGLIAGGDNQAAQELIKLERYQQYMAQVTPWWAWAENVLRSMDNGAMVTSSWPTPGSSITDVKKWVSNAGNVSDQILGTNIINSLPSISNSLDALPLERRDRMEVWDTSAGPFNFTVKTPASVAAIDYCLSWTGSFEMILNTAQTALSDAKEFQYWQPLFLFLQVLGGSVGCGLVGFAYSKNINNAHFDWVINTKNISNGNDWSNMTSNITLSYKPRSGRNSDSGDRRKFGFLKANAIGNIKNEGYFAIARSEIVYKKAAGTGIGLFDAIGNIPFLGDRLGLQDEPDMWSPRWTAKLRPVNLPNESLGAATGQESAGLNTVINDSLPYLLLAGTVGGFLDDNFTFSSAAQDLIFLAKSAQTFGNSQTKGIAK